MRDISFIIVIVGAMILIGLGYNSILHNILTSVIAVYFGFDAMDKIKKRKVK